MEDLVRKLLDEKVLTNDLIQEVFVSTKKYSSIEDGKVWDKIAQILWLHLHSGILKIDDQLLCATCFYSVIQLTGKEEFYLNEVLHMIKGELQHRENDSIINPRTVLVVSLTYGLFQSSFLITSARNSVKPTNLNAVLELTFDLLIQMAYDYSRNTFIVFKTIHSFKKVCGTAFEDCIYNQNNNVRLLNLVNHNWENPITGIRDLNKTIFQTLVAMMSDAAYESLLDEINAFYWNKAKYLMLSEMIEQYKSNVSDLVKRYDWLTGLACSLKKPGLVSAGTDMYFAILKKLLNEDDWVDLFLPIINDILNGSSTKAVENFINYWTLTTFKKFPSLINIFVEIFENTKDSEMKLYNSLYVLKQANKLGLIDKQWELNTEYNLTEKMVTLGLEHCNVYIRMAAFDILCVSQGKAMPNNNEYDLVINYLNTNVNSDCTVLRLSMLSGLKNFLVQIHSVFINKMKSNESYDKTQLFTFLKKLQGFIITNLNIKGNYQRKIASIKVCSIVLETLSNIPKNKKKQTRQSEATLLKVLKDKKQWLLDDHEVVLKLISFLQDPSDDIRENVIQLLLDHYSKAFRDANLINHVIEEALKSIGSKFFYEISCGQSMFKLIVNILIKENLVQSIFKTVEDVFTFSCNELLNEQNLKRDIMESIENGKQLHSFMDILIVVLRVCSQNSYRITIRHNDMLEILTSMERISNHFAWEETSSSSDFSKISDMVQEIITNSGHTQHSDEDQTKITGLQQIVLNCLWLNVKACCDLSTLLIQRCEEVEHIEKLLLIITNVLETSRHKGAIESAGASLGQAIQYLTSQPDETGISNIPYALLKSKLKELIAEASKMASITRRGAGLSIMVHRIVSSDMKKGKPLFHYFMNMILETCSNTEDMPLRLSNNMEIDNEKDLPKAIYIHFLTRIVTDSSIASDVMYYSPQLAKLAFDNLTSSHWQIRNAALQLYGALVPKLIGQKKASGTGEETIATVACDELRTHSPKLWIYIIAQLKNINNTDKVLSHSVLMPILNMLANSAKRYNFSSDTTEKDTVELCLLPSLVLLLDSPIYSVRRLTAKCIFNIFSFEVIYKSIMCHGLLTENSLHGNLMLLAHCYNYYSNDEYSSKFNDLKNKMHNKFIASHSYVCRQIFEDIFANDTSPSIDIILETLGELDENLHAPGISMWANTRIEKYLMNVAWPHIVPIVKLFMSRNDFEFCCEIILQKFELKKEAIPDDLLLEFTELLLSYDKKYNHCALWKILYAISKLMCVISCQHVNAIIKTLKTQGVSYKIRYILPFVARVMSDEMVEDNAVYLSEVIDSLCNPEMVDVEMRLIAAMSINELGLTFHNLPDNCKITTIKSVVILLQDEDEDVRNLSTVFLKNIMKTEMILHPYISLHKILDSRFLNKVLSEPQSGISVLKKNLTDFLLKSTNKGENINYNPFANDSKNIYLEVEVLQELIKNVE